MCSFGKLVEQVDTGIFWFKLLAVGDGRKICFSFSVVLGVASKDLYLDLYLIAEDKDAPVRSYLVSSEEGLILES